jgi:RNA polymerase sigma-70 factor (ECF subfamily)
VSAQPRQPCPAETTDAELLADVAGGQLGALGELYDRYARDVWRAVRRSLPNDAAVDDVVHATFLNLPRIAGSYDGRAASCRNWLCGIGVRLAMRHRRGAGRLQRMLGSFAQTLVGRKSNDPEHRASQHQELTVLNRALARLSEKKRAVFVLVELEGLSAAEAAAALAIPAATARTRLFHARRELQQAMQRGGVE